MCKKNLAIFNSLLLGASETFIKSQAEGLCYFKPYYFGSRLTKGLSLPSEQTTVVNQGGLIGTIYEGLFKLTGSSPKLEKQLKRIKPTLIHAHFGLSGALALPIAQKLNLPFVVTFHGSDATSTDEYARHASLNHRIYLRRRDALKKSTNLFIAVSKFIETKLIEKGFPAEKILVHYIGVDIKKFQADCHVVREPVVLFVGRLTEKKGCQYLIKAMAKVQATLPDAKLIIIGDGPLRTNLEDLAINQKLQNYSFLGSQSHEVVQKWMNKALVLAAPSITAATGDSEGLPMVVLEASAMGLPVVSSLHAGIPEAVVHGKTGFLTKEKDWESLSDYLLLLMNNSSLWKNFSTRAQEQVRLNFNIETQVKTLEEIYESVWKQKSNLNVSS